MQNGGVADESALTVKEQATLGLTERIDPLNHTNQHES